MQKSFSLIFSVVFYLSGYSQDLDFTIKLEMKKYPTGSIAFLHYQGMKGEVKDSTEIGNSVISFRGKIDEPRPASLFIREPGKKASSQNRLYFYLEPGDIGITSRSMLSNAEVTGSSATTELIKMNRLFVAVANTNDVRVVQETRMVSVPAGSAPPSGMGSNVGRGTGCLGVKLSIEELSQI